MFSSCFVDKFYRILNSKFLIPHPAPHLAVLKISRSLYGKRERVQFGNKTLTTVSDPKLIRVAVLLGNAALTRARMS